MANYTASCIDLQDPDTFKRLVLDSSAMVRPTVADECRLAQVELYIREYIHEIHKKESHQIKAYCNQIEILTKCNNMNNVNSTTVHKYTRVTALEQTAAKGTRSTQLKQSDQLSLPQ